MAQTIAPILNNWATWWIADDKFVWIANSFQDISNLEIRKFPKQVQLQYAMVKDSWSVVVDKINCSLTISSTWDIMAFGNAWNIYVKSLWWARQKVYTHSTWYSILGCIEYNQYIYWATLDKLHRTDISSVSTAISWGTLTPTDLNWKTLNWITYSNWLQTSYTLDTSVKYKTGEKIYVKKNYNLWAVWISSWTTAPTKAYLIEAPVVPAIAWNSLRLYTSSQVDVLTWSPVWTEARPSWDNNRDWRITDVSINWQIMLAWAYWWRLYTSADWWANWTERQPLGDNNGNWLTWAISDDWTKMIVAEDAKRLWYSTDSGANWTETRPDWDADKDWTFVKITPSGAKYFVWNKTKVFTSTNWSSWTDIKTQKDVYEIFWDWEISNDWNRILLTWWFDSVSSTPYNVYYTVDWWSNWSTKLTTSLVPWYNKCTMTDDWLFLFVTERQAPQELHYSLDNWATWSDVTIAEWVTNISCDYLGQIVTLSTTKRIYRTLDLFTSTNEYRPAGDVDKSWNNIKLWQWAIRLQTVNVTTWVATFSTSITAGKYYYILADKEWSSYDASYKTTSYPVTKTDINYINWVAPYTDTTKSRLITSLWTTIVNDIAHPMITSNWTLYIGDWQFVATIDPAGAYVWDTLELAEMDKIYDITYNNAYVRIYCIQWTSSDTWIAYFWDWVQPAPDQRQELPGKFRNVTMRDNIDYTIMWTNETILYFYPYQRQLLKRITNFSSGIKSMINYKNYLLFWALWGVYSWWNFNKDYPECLNLEYKTSNGNNTDEIWCIWNSNGDLYVWWKNWTSYWIDKLSTTVYSLTWYLTSRVFYWSNMFRRKDDCEIYISHEPLIAWQTIKVYTKKNLSWSFTLSYTIDSTNWAVSENNFQLQQEFFQLEIKLELEWPWTSTPIIYECVLRLNQESEW